jgi:predicted permease
MSLPHPLRTTLRRLARSPLFTAVTVLTLAIGIGATTAVFTVVHGVLLEPLPFEHPERLVGVWHTAPGLGFDRLNQSPALYFTYREESEAFTDTGLWDNDTASITGRGEPAEVPVIRVTDGTLPLLGVRPLHGRLFSAEDDSPGTAETVILAHDYWRERFGADPAAVGQTLLVDGRPREVIAVMRPDLEFLDFEPSIYLPYRLDRGEVFFGNFSHQGVARLAPGATLDQANDEVARMIPMALDRFPLPAGFTREMATKAGLGPNLRPLREDVVGDVGRLLWVLLGTVGIVLLIACGNVANLYLVRAEARRQELAVRSALGAGRARIGRGFLLESLLLGFAGGAAGLGLAWAGIRLLVTLSPRGLPRLDEIAIDPSVVLFTLGVSIAAALAFSILPVIKLGGPQLLGALREGGRGAVGRGRNVTRNALVAVQIALALVLMIASGLMIRSFQALRSVDPGFREPAEVQTLRLAIPEAEVEEPERVVQLHEELRRRLAALPGVESVALTTSITMDGWDSNDPIFFEDFPPPADQIPPLRRFKWVSPGYLETMRQPLVAGRDLSWADVHDRAPVALVTENVAREHWPDDPAGSLGRRIKPYPTSPWRTIVGVVGDIRDDGPGEPATATVYWPMAMNDFFEPGLFAPRGMAYAIRSSRVGTPGFLDEVRRTIWAVNRNLPLARVETLEEIVADSTARTSFTLVMLAIAAATALLLGGIGIYGVTSYAVAQRRREIGVRMALGARRRDVGGLVLRHGLALAGIGVAAGLAAAVGLTRLMSALLYGVGAVDPATYALGGAGAVALTLLASWFPARRAAAVDPLETLR